MKTLTTHRIQVVPGRDVATWIQFINENRIHVLQRKPLQLTVDFGEATFINAWHVVSLACLIEEYFMEGIQIKFQLSGVSDSIRLYLEKMSFFRHWEPGTDRNNFAQDLAERVMPIWKVDCSRTHFYIDYTRQYYQNNFLLEQDLSPISIVMAEIFNNIQDHSESKVSGYCLVQYAPNRHELSVSICDFGVGIPNKINAYRKQKGEAPIGHEKALMDSVIKGYSTKSTPQNRGLGLDLVLSNVKATNSSLLIVANEAILRREESREETAHEGMQNSFLGTHIHLRMDTTNLEKIEKVEGEDELFS
ncbi:MAG: hypothetical protein IBJ09_06165 [Bacteroidia bacterium]|nr:hypothetical protein [Bacteroidia bacterium]